MTDKLSTECVWDVKNFKEQAMWDVAPESMMQELGYY